MSWTLYCGCCYEVLDKVRGRWVSYDVPLEDGTVDHFCVECWEEDLYDNLTIA